MNEDFSIIPSELFYNKDDKGLLKEIGNDKILLIVDFLDFHTLKNGKVQFNLRTLIEMCGYKEDRHKNGINSQFKNILIAFEDMNIIKNAVRLFPTRRPILMKDINIGDYVECELDIVSKVNGKNTNFIQLYAWEKEKLLQYKTEKIDNVKLLVYYCYLKSRMYRRGKSDGKFFFSGGRAEVCYPSFSKICADINISEDSIIKYNKILVKLDMIRYGNAGMYYNKNDDTKKLTESNNTYMLYQSQWEDVLKDTLKEFKRHEEKNGKVFVNNKDISKQTENVPNNKRKLSGYINRVNYLESVGKATEEQIIKRNEYIILKQKCAEG